MSYNLQTLRTRVQQRLDDDSFDTAILNQFINDGQRDVLNTNRFRFMERSAYITTEAGSKSFTNLPDDFQVAIKILDLRYLEDDMLDNLADTKGRPSMWSVFGGKPYVFPTADDTYTYNLKYLKKPDELADDEDVPEIPEEFGEVIVLAAYKRALDFNDENDKSQMIQLQVDDLIDQMSLRYTDQLGTPHIMRQPRRGR